MFELDSRVKNEALNFAALMNALGVTENKLEPYFTEYSKIADASAPINGELRAYSEYFGVPADKLLSEYIFAKKAFTRLREGDEIIKRGSREYPPLLMETKQAPRFLYVRGRKSLLLEKRSVAIVGSREASKEGRVNTRRLAESLGRNGINVISGLASGIDVTAHRTALECGFNTVSVTSLNGYYPQENRDVQVEIEKKGLVVSQFSPATKTQRWFFPMRNGVMSGLSLATVIMEAGETSGALRQAEFAFKQGRQVFFLRKALGMEGISWPERYVKRGALAVDTPGDVLRKLAENEFLRMDAAGPMQLTLEDCCRTDGKERAAERLAYWMKPMLCR